MPALSEAEVTRAAEREMKTHPHTPQYREIHRHKHTKHGEIDPNPSKTMGTPLQQRLWDGALAFEALLKRAHAGRC